MSLFLKSNNGYTLLNALLQLSVFFLFTHFVLMIVYMMKDTKEELMAVEETEWELFIVESISLLKEVNEITILAGGKGLQFKSPKETAIIEYYAPGNLIRKRKNNGHEPLLLSVRQVYFSLNKNDLTISVEFKNGLRKERTIYVSPSS